MFGKVCQHTKRQNSVGCEAMVSHYAFHTDCQEVIEHCSQVVTTTASYLGGPGFKFQPEDWLS
jgi:hypothetical protein